MWRARRARGRLTHQVAFPAEGAASWSDAERATAQGSALSAMSLLRQAVRQDPRHAYAATRLADLLIQQGQLAGGQALLRGVQAHLPRDAPMHLMRNRVNVDALSHSDDAGHGRSSTQPGEPA